MYRKQPMQSQKLKMSESTTGEMLEIKIARLMSNKETPDQTVPLIYTERSEGIQPAYDIRTDKWDIALDGMAKVAQTHVMRREMRIGESIYDTMTDEKQKEFNTKFPENKHAKAINAAKTAAKV